MRTIATVTTGKPVCGIRLVRAHLNLPMDDPSDDFVLAQYLAAAQALIVEDLGCPLTLQTFDEVADRFTYPLNGGQLQLWMRPMRSIVEVASISDDDGFTETLLTSSFGPAGDVGVAFARDWRWPARRLRVRYTAGWEVGSVPEPLVVATLMTTADLYANRESLDISDGRAVAIVNPTADRITRPYRRFN